MDFTGKALVTGASGFVGSARSAQAGRARACRARAGAPAAARTQHLAGLDLEFVTGDLRDPESVRQAMAGVRFVFHVAADYRLWARDPNEIIENNVAGTRIVMEAAQRAGVERIVYTSSVATLKTGPSGETCDETIPLDESHADRRLQAQQGRGRAPGRGDGGASRACRRSSSIRRRRSARATSSRRRPAG